MSTNARRLAASIDSLSCSTKIFVNKFFADTKSLFAMNSSAFNSIWKTSGFIKHLLQLMNNYLPYFQVDLLNSKDFPKQLHFADQESMPVLKAVPRNYNSAG